MVRPVHRARRVASGLGAAVWVALPLAVLALLVFLNTQLRLSDPVDTWVAVEKASSTSATPIELALTWSTPQAPVAPSWDGVVQSVYVAPGSVLASGDKIVRINGVDRIGFAGKAPFWRPIEAGMSGDDVAELNRLLGALGFRQGPASSATAATMAGVEQLCAKLGATDRSVFKPDWVIHLAAAELTIEKVDIAVASPAPAAGTALLTPAASLTSARLVVKGSLPPPAAQAPSGQSKDSGTKQQSSEPAKPAGRAYTAPQNGRVLSAGTQLPVDETRQAIAADGLPALLKQLERGASSASVLVETPVPAEAMVLPAAAVRTSAEGHCVIRREGNASEAPVRVDVVGESAGRVVVVGDLTAGTTVLASPRKAQACE